MEMNNNFDNPLLENDSPETKSKETNINSNSNKKNFILLIIILFISSIFIIGLVIYGLNNGGTRITKNNSFSADDLFVLHSKKDFGDEITDISSYKSIEKAYYYTFYVENPNNESISYKVIMEDVGEKKDSADKSKINYAFYKNDDLVFSGVLDKNKKTFLSSTKLVANGKDNYKIKLWSNNTKGYYKFIVNITN